jgi:hypothetical protein
MKKSWLVLVVFSLLLLLQGCEYENEEDRFPAPCELTGITYNSRIQPLLSQKCASVGCHGGTSVAAGIRLDNYTDAKAVAESGALERVTAVQRTMPPSGPLPACGQEAIKKWIELGMPED